jgi:hypothetical protein
VIGLLETSGPRAALTSLSRTRRVARLTVGTRGSQMTSRPPGAVTRAASCSARRTSSALRSEESTVSRRTSSKRVVEGQRAHVGGMDRRPGCPCRCGARSLGQEVDPGEATGRRAGGGQASEPPRRATPGVEHRAAARQHEGHDPSGHLLANRAVPAVVARPRRGLAGIRRIGVVGGADALALVFGLLGRWDAEERTSRTGPPAPSHGLIGFYYVQPGHRLAETAEPPPIQ